MNREQAIMTMDRLSNFYKSTIDFISFKNKESEKYNLVKNNEKYFNVHKGKRCFILGNGPSLNEIDLRTLKDEYTFTVNELFRHPMFEEIQSNYHFIADPYYFRRNNRNKTDSEVLRILQDMGKRKNSPSLFLPVEACDFVKRYKILKCNFFCSKLYFYSGYKEKINFSKYIPAFQGVIQWSIAMAVFMGFKEIYLLGCDGTNLITDLGSFKGTTRDEKYAFKIDEATEESQKKDFQKKGLTCLLNGYNRIFEIFREMRLYCKRNGVKLYNCSKNSIIDSIPQIDFDSIIKKQKDTAEKD